MPRKGYRGPRGHQAKPKPRRDGIVRHGGVRAGAGRKPGPVPWKEVQRMAEAGAPYEEIVGGLDIKPEALQDRGVQEQLRAAVERGNTKFKLRLRVAIKRRGMRQGSVNSLALMARNTLDWDQQLAQTTAAPDLTGVGARLVELIGKLARRATPSSTASSSSPPTPSPTSSEGTTSSEAPPTSGGAEP